MKYIFNSLFESEETNKKYVFGKDTKISFVDDVLYIVVNYKNKDQLEKITTLTNDDKTIQEQIEYLINKGILDEI